MNRPQNADKLAVYVTSLDKSSDLWGAFFKMFSKNWPDCPYKVYLGNNSDIFQRENIIVLNAQNHSNWSDRALEHLEQIPEPYVLMLLDDWFLYQLVDSLVIDECFGCIIKLDGVMLRLVPDPKPDYALAGLYKIGLLKVGKLNRTNTHATIWHKEALVKLITKGESLWEFEVNGSIRSNVYSGGIYCVWNPIIKYFGAVERGKWTRYAVRKLAQERISIDLKRRAVKTFNETFYHFVYNKIASCLRLLLGLRLRQIIKSKYAR